PRAVSHHPLSRRDDVAGGLATDRPRRFRYQIPNQGAHFPNHGGMITMKGRMLSAGLVLVGLWPGLATAEWGKPLGGTYDGPEGKPRVVTPSPAELSVDERATMAVFERATKSVVFIANTAIQRDPWSLNTFEGPDRDSSGTSRGISSRIFMSSMEPIRSPSRWPIGRSIRLRSSAPILIAMWRCCRFVRRRRRSRPSLSGDRMICASGKRYWRSGTHSGSITR